MTGGDRHEVERAVAALWAPGAVYELRVLLSHKRTVSGYYDEPERFIEHALHWSGKAPGVYATLNPVEPALLARAENRWRDWAGTMTSDRDIAQRRFVPLDFDPPRPSGISSSDQEHEAAIQTAKDAGRWLLQMGIPRTSMLLADSGNGAHLLIRADLPQGDEATEVVNHCIRAVALRFSDDRVGVDLKNGNPARIWKVYGTLAMKGDDTPERPHRLARILQDDLALMSAPMESVRRVAACAPMPERPATPAAQRFDIRAWMERYLAGSIAHEGPYEGGHKWVLTPCPINADHTNRSAVIIEHPSGAISFTCHHNGCAGIGWRELRERLEPDAYTPAVAVPEAAPRHPPAPRQPAADRKPKLHTLPSMAHVQREDVLWLWSKNIPRAKITLVEGDPEARKTWLMLMVMACLSRGWALPGDTVHRDPERVLLLAGEDGYGDTIRPRLEGMDADLSMIRPVLGLVRENEEEALTLDAVGVAALLDEVEAYKPALVGIDPLIAYTGAGMDMNKANEVRAMLRPLADMAQRLGTAVLASRHLNKASTTPVQYRGQGSIDYRAISRSILFVAIDQENPLRSIVVPGKSSLAERGPGWAFTVVQGAHGPSVAWDGQVDMTMQELLALPLEPEHRTQIDEAKVFLGEILGDGPVLGRDVQRQAKEVGIAERTLWRAKESLKIRTAKSADGPWVWALPPHHPDDMGADSDNSVMSANSANYEGLADMGGRVGRVGSAEVRQPLLHPANTDDPEF